MQHEVETITSRPRGADLLRALAQLAEDKPAAFDALVPTIVPLVMGAVGGAA